jgi:glycosyltransferase involved in cell wall biosynthesis
VAAPIPTEPPAPDEVVSASVHGLKLAIVLWNGRLGGAETLKASLAREWRRSGIDASVVFVTGGADLAQRLERDGIPHVSVGLTRGRGVLVHPRRFASVVSAAGPDGALLVDTGYLAAGLRAGGYKGRIVGVEHGKLLTVRNLSFPRRLKDRLERSCGSRFRATDVGVSQFMVDELRRHPHAPRVCRIYNGVDSDLFVPAGERPRSAANPMRIGTAARLIAGKGIEHLLRAVGRLQDVEVRVDIAGDGPQSRPLRRLAEDLGLASVVSFRGPVVGMPGFWRSCDLAVVPSDTFVESFSMATLEAMACGVPVVATRNGGIPEVLSDGETGTIVPPGDPDALATAIRTYATDPELRRRHAAAARERARRFGIEASAGQYLSLFAPRPSSP